MIAFYNETDEYCCQWLGNLINAGLIMPGIVDRRPIQELQPHDLEGFTQVHLFAGLGGWARAARLAGWPDDRQLWSASAPCQPFSVAGLGIGIADERHLWPHVHRLAEARRPPFIVGEQVAAAIGKNWLDGVFSDLESLGYACRAVVIPACAVNAPHRRDRTWFVAGLGLLDYCDHEGLERFGWNDGTEVGREIANRSIAATGRGNFASDSDGFSCGQGDSVRAGRADRSRTGQIAGSGCGSEVDSVGVICNADELGPREKWSERSRQLGGARRDPCGGDAWDSRTWVIGHDGKARRVPEPESGICLLAHGIPARVGKLRALGNAIVPQIAAEILAAWMDCY